MEDYLIEKLAVAEMKRKERLRNLEWLGSNMVAAGQELTPGDTYGSALIKCGQTQLKIGQIEREFAAKAERDFIRPLKRFLDEGAKALVVGSSLLLQLSPLIVFPINSKLTKSDFFLSH